MAEIAEVVPWARDEFDPYLKGSANFTIAPGYITGLFVYCCSACKKTEYHQYFYYGTPMNPGLDGWTKVERYGGATMFCKDHKIEEQLIVDGRKLTNG